MLSVGLGETILVTKNGRVATLGRTLPVLVGCRLLGLCRGIDSTGGANLGATAAFDAGVGVDVVDLAFGDSANGAYGQAGAASNADVGDYVSHSSVLSYIC